MNILWLNANLLLPLDKGGRLRTWNLMRHLARRHEITYVSFADPGADPSHFDGMQAVAASLSAIRRTDPPKGSVAFYLDAGIRVVDPLPYAIGKYRSALYRREVERLLAHGTFDLLVCDFLVPAVNLPRVLPCPAVLFTHNVEAEIWRRHYEQARDPVRRLLLRQQWRRMLKFEARTLGRFDMVLAVSDADRRTLQRLYAETLRVPVVTVATGVDTEYFSPDTTPPVPGRLVFTGSMDWLPNEDAMVYFCSEILPLIRREEPGVSLSIVGRAPTPAVRRLAETAGVEVTGTVPDVRGHLARAQVYVVPLRIGGGTRLKIFEAMSAGKAIVSTSVGAEGLPVLDGQHLYLRDDAAEFASAVVSLLRDPVRRAQLEATARDLVVARHDWAAVAGDLDHALSVTARRASEAA